MKSVKCFECGFVGWADAEHCKKCGAERLPEPVGHFHQAPANYGSYQQPYGNLADLKKGTAIFALVLGILNLMTLGLVGVGAVAGIVVAAMALSKIKSNPHVYGGKELATAGLISSILSLVLIVPIGIVAAIAIPNLMAARRAANEASTIASLRSIHAAEATYQATRGAGAFGTLDQLASERLINPALASGAHNGYRFSLETNPSRYNDVPGFQLVVVPLTYGSSGNRSFYVDETGVIRAEDNRGREANELTPPLNNRGYSSSSPPPSRYDSSGDY